MNFIVAFEGLVGSERPPGEAALQADMERFTDFALELTLPPTRRERFVAAASVAALAAGILWLLQAALVPTGLLWAVTGPLGLPQIGVSEPWLPGASDPGFQVGLLGITLASVGAGLASGSVAGHPASTQWLGLVLLAPVLLATWFAETALMGSVCGWLFGPVGLLAGCIGAAAGAWWYTRRDASFSPASPMVADPQSRRLLLGLSFVLLGLLVLGTLVFWYISAH